MTERYKSIWIEAHAAALGDDINKKLKDLEGDWRVIGFHPLPRDHRGPAQADPYVVLLENIGDWKKKADQFAKDMREGGKYGMNEPKQ